MRTCEGLAMNKLQICMVLLTLGWATPAETARALPEYPKYLQSAAQTPCLPHCNVCHRDDNAGSGTIDQPFGKSLQEVGHLGGGGKSDVTRAVGDLRTQNTDSDRDGVSDIDELSAGEDPNYAGDGSICGPQVGCSAVGQRDDSWPTWLVICAVFSLAVFLSRGRDRLSR
ncbi:MAG: hypothetical protein JWN48_5655 [Myxococcaceae bacterium]|nr:hypothetical protein [Myxococcaceae bacterium]